MAIKGSLSEASLSDVIQMICTSKKTGCLSLTDGTNFGTIFISEGKIMLAKLTPHKRQIGDILLQMGKITEEQLHQALDVQEKNRDKKLGAILIEIGAITDDDLRLPLKLQTEDAIFTMLLWNTGFFSFEPDLHPAPDELMLDIPYEGLLIDSARRIDEWKEIEDKLPPKETILVRKKSVVQLDLTEDEYNVLNLIDDKRSLDEVISMSPLPTLETCKAVHVLFTAGLIDAVEPKREDVAARAKERYNVGLAFYKTGMHKEAIQEFLRVIELTPEDKKARFYLSLAYYRCGESETAIDHLAKIGEEPPVLFNLALSYYRIGELEEALSILNKLKETEPDSTRLLSIIGLVYFAKRAYEEAESSFKRLKEKDPDNYLPYFYLPMIRIREKDFATAINLLSEAIEKFPSKGELRNNLAVLFEALNKNREAEQAYRAAINQDPFNPLIHKNFGSFYYNRNVMGAAREQFEAIEESNRDWETNFKLANIMLKLGNRSEALHYYKKAQEQKPDDPTINRNIKILENEAE
ncbi:MAG TPA: tetratricopeptide repeat protein [bacterium (Candidatus Stahlbacteria)]|nr:tetratricopeptide repeat protein [Candidatus Stahlbacteria bacterium]